MGERDTYFQPLKDAVTVINHKVNLFGVVVESSFCRKSRGTDFYCTLKVVDQSHSEFGVAVNFFTENMDMLPHVASGGDIIRLTRVMMKVHAGEVYAVFNKKYSSFALYKGENGEDLIPYQSSSRFSPINQDKEYIENLRKWFLNFELDKGPENLLSLGEVKEGELNLVCKILHIRKFVNESWIAFVWDGTDAPPNGIFKKLEDEKDDPLPLEIEPMPLARELLRAFPPIGSVLRVIFDQDIENDLHVHMLNAGKWVIFLNMICEVHAGLWHGVLKPFSKIHYIPKKENLILERERQYDQRQSDKLGKMPSWSLPWTSHVTEIEHEYAPFATLRDVLTYPKVTTKFRCVVRAVAMMPWLAEDFCSPKGIYRLRLTLEDPTARIHAYVYDKDGEKLFDGYPSFDELTRKQEKMLGVAVGEDGSKIAEAPRNPPWMQCCLKSYYLDKGNPWETRNFRIFDTKLVA